MTCSVFTSITRRLHLVIPLVRVDSSLGIKTKTVKNIMGSLVCILTCKTIWILIRRLYTEACLQTCPSYADTHMRKQSRHNLMVFHISIIQTKPRRMRVTPATILAKACYSINLILGSHASISPIIEWLICHITKLSDHNMMALL